MTIIEDNYDQGSDQWYAARIGCITMSNAKALITGGKGLTRKNYLLDVASEIVSGQPSTRINSKDIMRGNLLEPYARLAYEEVTGNAVRQIGFGYLDEMRRIGASPDGLTDNGGVEIKCPNPKGHLRTIIDNSVPKEYMPQVQGCMFVFGVDSWDFVSFCPQFKINPIHIIKVQRDEKMIDEISKSAYLGMQEIDAFIDESIAENNDAVNAICDRSMLILSEIYDEEPDII